MSCLASSGRTLGVRALGFRVARLSGIPLLVRRLIQRRRTTILLYHDVAPEVADTHLAFLCRAYNVITLRSYVEARVRGDVDQLPPRSLVITLDDGPRGNARLGPVLRRHGVTPTIFVCSGLVGTSRGFWFRVGAFERERIEELKAMPDTSRRAAILADGFDETAERAEREALSREEVQSLREVVDFQSHTISHAILSRCSDERAREEIAGSKHQLEREYGLDIYALSFPNSDYTLRDKALAREAGYLCALTVDEGFNDARTDLFALRRIGVADYDGVDELVVKASGVWPWIRRRLGRGRKPGPEA